MLKVWGLPPNFRCWRYGGVLQGFFEALKDGFLLVSSGLKGLGVQGQGFGGSRVSGFRVW